MDAGGNIQWPLNGIPVCAVGDEHDWPQIISDGSHGAIITWLDKRAADWAIYAQRLAADGSVHWTPGGELVYGPVYTIAVFDSAILLYDNLLQLVSDGSEGAIIIWMDKRNGNWDVYAQRVNAANGATLWTAGGVAVCDDPNRQVEPAIVSDGSGGAIIVWADKRNGSDEDVYAQRVDSTGNGMWGANGKAVSAANWDQDNPAIASDGSGGAIIAWEDDRDRDEDIYAQRMDGNGNPLWAANGIPISLKDYDQFDPVIIGDGAGGAFIVWDSFNALGVPDLYAQRISSDGAEYWTENGIVVCAGAYASYDHVAALVEAGKAVVSWTDDWAFEEDVFAQKIGTGQEMDLKQGATNLADGAAHDFGVRNTGSGTDVVFTIENPGAEDLILTLPLILTGTDAGQFSIQDQPASPIAGGGFDTFTVRFSPTSVGGQNRGHKHCQQRWG